MNCWKSPWQFLCTLTWYAKIIYYFMVNRWIQAYKKSPAESLNGGRQRAGIHLSTIKSLSSLRTPVMGWHTKFDLNPISGFATNSWERFGQSEQFGTARKPQMCDERTDGWTVGQVHSYITLHPLAGDINPNTTRCVDGTPTPEVTTVAVPYIQPPHHAHPKVTAMIMNHEESIRTPFVPCQPAFPFLRLKIFQTLTLKIQGQGREYGQRAT